MNIDELREEIQADEGRVNEIYLCTESVKTTGIGHALKPHDIEYDLPVGTAISDDRIDALFKQDVEIAIEDCKYIFLSWDQQNDEVKKILCNMAFQMGQNRLSKFKKMIAALEAWPPDYDEAANQMYDSRWRRQTPNRANRLIARMRKVGEAEA